jgi:steroid delta-isomerase-like uncharacterized protein
VSAEDNKKLVRDAWAAFAARDIAKMVSFYAPDAAYHGAGGEERRGRDSLREFAGAYSTAFPDMRIDVEHQVAEGDYVVSRVRPHGTNTGELMGMPATGKAVELRWVMQMCRIASGQIAEEWEIWDNADFMGQLGIGG